MVSGAAFDDAEPIGPLEEILWNWEEGVWVTPRSPIRKV